MMLKTLASTALIFLFLIAPTVGQGKGFKLSTEDELKEDVSQGPCRNDDRFEAVKKLFVKMGAAESDFHIDKFKGVQNITLTKKGKTAETIIIGAHYDKVSSGCGTIDNWTGIVIMAHLFRAISNINTEKTYLFVAFDREEDGLLGSEAMVKNIPKDARAGYCSMVNLDSFGLGYPMVLENMSTLAMIKSAVEMGKELNVKVDKMSVPGAGADSMSFTAKDMPAITISGMTDKWASYLHSSNDQMKYVLPASVRLGYNFTLQYVGRLDAGACGMFRKK